MTFVMHLCTRYLFTFYRTNTNDPTVFKVDYSEKRKKERTLPFTIEKIGTYQDIYNMIFSSLHLQLTLPFISYLPSWI